MRWILFALALVIAGSIDLTAQKAPASKQSKIVSELKQIEIDIGQASIRVTRLFSNMWKLTNSYLSIQLAV